MDSFVTDDGNARDHPLQRTGGVRHPSAKSTASSGLSGFGRLPAAQAVGSLSGHVSDEHN